MLELASLPEVATPLAVVGPSGSGKTTLLEILALVRPPDSAACFSVAGRNGKTHALMSLWAARDEATLTNLRASQIGFAPQRGGYFVALSARDNIRLRADIGARRSVALENRIDALADLLELSKAELSARPPSLSAGQRQRLAIMLALIHEPDLIIADEPTSALHPTLSVAVFDLLREEAARTGARLIIATHEVELARKRDFALLSAITQQDGRDLSTRFIPA